VVISIITLGGVSHAHQTAQPVDGKTVDGHIEEKQAHGEPEQGVFLLHPPAFHQTEDEKKDEQAEKDGEKLDSVKNE
jgi:hypothetical protein